MQEASLSIFFPAFNDAPSLPRLVQTAFEVAGKLAPDFEVIVINDGSRDSTPNVLEQLQLQYGDRLRVITHPENQGYGAALRSGFRAATKDLVFYTDGDGQYDVAELSKLLELLTPATGFVNGYKIERRDPWRRVVLGKLYNRFASFLFGIRIRDIDCDYRLIRRQLVEEIALESTSGAVCVELVRKLEMSGWSWAETGVHHYPRTHGRSQFFRLRSLATTARQLFRLYLTLVVLPAFGRKAERVV